MVGAEHTFVDYARRACRAGLYEVGAFAGLVAYYTAISTDRHQDFTASARAEALYEIAQCLIARHPKDEKALEQGRWILNQALDATEGCEGGVAANVLECFGRIGMMVGDFTFSEDHMLRAKKIEDPSDASYFAHYLARAYIQLRKGRRTSEDLLVALRGLDLIIEDKGVGLIGDALFCQAIHDFHAGKNPSCVKFLTSAESYYAKSPSYRASYYRGLVDLSVYVALAQGKDRRRSLSGTKELAHAYRVAGWIRLAGKSPLPYSLTEDGFGRSPAAVRVRTSVIQAEANCFAAAANPEARRLVADALAEMRDYRKDCVKRLPYLIEYGIPLLCEIRRHSMSSELNMFCVTPFHSPSGDLSRQIVTQFVRAAPSIVLRTYPKEAIGLAVKLLSTLKPWLN